MNPLTKVFFESRAEKEYKWWKESDLKVVVRIKALIDDIKAQPFAGLGRPEPLKYQKQGYWSRRIDKKNRLVYFISDDTIVVISCKDHYEKY